MSDAEPPDTGPNSRDGLLPREPMGDATPLPSREQAAEAIEFEMTDAADLAWQLLVGRASGRLVDREAINYEAAEKVIRVYLPSNLLRAERINIAGIAVDAAIGDTDG